MLYELIGIVFIFLFLWGIVVTVNWGRSRLDNNRTQVQELRITLSQAHARILKDERVLRSIANGAGSPVLEAQIGLDEITSYWNDVPNTKEIA